MCSRCELPTLKGSGEVRAITSLQKIAAWQREGVKADPHSCIGTITHFLG